MHGMIFSYIVFAAVVSTVFSANILDLLNWDQDSFQVEKRDESSDSTAERSCACNGPSCICCVDFNLTYIDLGGPGCVRMKYISQKEGIAVNVSYGDSLLHSKQVKGPKPEPTCMSLLVNLAQICARFSDLQPNNDGLKGCLLLEPKLLGDVTATFNIGCFTMGPEGMKLENTTFVQNFNQTHGESEGINEEELMAAVNESAEQGLVFFGNLLGLTFGNSETNENTTETVTSTSTNATSGNSTLETSRKAKFVKLSPNQI